MKDTFLELMVAVITAVVPVLTVFAVKFTRQLRDEAMTNTDDVKRQWYIEEITDAIVDAVSATSQTYVDSLKNSGSFDIEAQKEAARRALQACLAAISPAAQEFIEQMYGDVTEYLTNRIEAEVRKQKMTVGLPLEAISIGTSDPDA